MNSKKRIVMYAAVLLAIVAPGAWLCLPEKPVEYRVIRGSDVTTKGVLYADHAMYLNCRITADCVEAIDAAFIGCKFDLESDGIRATGGSVRISDCVVTVKDGLDDSGYLLGDGAESFTVTNTRCYGIADVGFGVVGDVTFGDSR